MHKSTRKHLQMFRLYNQRIKKESLWDYGSKLTRKDVNILSDYGGKSLRKRIFVFSCKCATLIWENLHKWKPSFIYLSECGDLDQLSLQVYRLLKTWTKYKRKAFYWIKSSFKTHVLE